MNIEFKGQLEHGLYYKKAVFLEFVCTFLLYTKNANFPIQTLKHGTANVAFIEQKIEYFSFSRSIKVEQPNPMLSTEIAVLQ